ncbi:hypothetical protein tb265_16490 [Gemmatimonadetes bacterium T265]|nr:hypothetical protein tb265_16490 [Gemmatimonadetes bacterium T265]
MPSFVRARTRSVPVLPAGVLRARYEAAVREEGTDVGEAPDAVDLEVGRERGDLADARDPAEALDVRVGDERRPEFALESLDLCRQPRALLGVQVALEARERRELGRRRDVVLGEQARHGVLAARALGDEDEALTQGAGAAGRGARAGRD